MSRLIFPGWPRVIFFALTLGIFCAPVSAAPVDYLVDGWDTENGLPSSTVTSVEQTPEGYLWVGTYNGLARFDGVRFVTFDPANTPELTQTRVQGLYLDVNGTLWIATFRGGLTSFRNGVFHNELPDQSLFDLHTTLVASTSNLVTFVTQFGEVMQRDPWKTNSDWKIFAPPTGSRPFFQCADKSGRLWFLQRDGQILQFMDGVFKVLPDNGGLSASRIYTVVSGADGNIWAGAENEIARWNGSQFEAMTPVNSTADIEPQLIVPLKTGALWVLDGDRLRKMEGRQWTAEVVPWRGLLGRASGRAMGAHEDRAGGLWFNHYGNGLFHIAPEGTFQRFTTAENLPGDRVGAWFQSKDGGIWAGVDHGGLARLHDRSFHVIGANEGLMARTALSVCAQSNGVVWIGTAGGGLCTWSNGVINRFFVGGNASANFIFSIAPRPDGGVWLSAAEGEDLYQFSEGRMQRASWDVHGIKSMLTDHAGRVWMGTKSGIALTAGSERRWLGTNETFTLPAVRALAETPDGTIWAGADDGALYRCMPEGLTAFRPTDALAGQPIYSLIADGSGTLWAGTFRGGLLRFKNGIFTRITARQGLPVDVISQIVDDQHGRFWLGTHQGIYCVAKSVLNACADGRANSVNYISYGRHDGLPALECSDGYQPSSWRGEDGKLWFTTVRGVVWLHPDELTAKAVEPPVIIEEFRVDDGAQPLRNGKIIVPPGRQQFDFRFTALSFDAGDKVRFRYRMDGFDAGWVEAEGQRTAHYGKLPPHVYRFQVIACNSEGVWNETGAFLDFEVRPFFYQTWWFKILSGAAFVAVISFAVRRAATRKYRRKLVQLRQQHAIESDRARIAKDIHDDIGAGLTQITLLTELARRDPEQTGSNLERISDSARTLTKAMDEIVWAVDPQHDTFEGLMDYISAYAEDFLRVAGIRCRMDLPVNLPVMRVDAELRYNLFLALKEALNNVVKHAKASEVSLRLRVEQKSFTLIVEDNGRGFSDALQTASSRLSSGSGLLNMQQRLALVGGRCEINNSQKGTRVEMTVTIQTPASPVMAIGQTAERD